MYRPNSFFARIAQTLKNKAKTNPEQANNWMKRLGMKKRVLMYEQKGLFDESESPLGPDKTT